MLTVPGQTELFHLVRESLNEVAPLVRGRTSGCAAKLAEILEERLAHIDKGIECLHGSGRAPDRNEFMVDFLAGLWEPPDRNSQRFLMQPLIVGEIEWHNSLDKDFDKLLLANSLVCFFVFPETVKERLYPNRDWLTFFQEKAQCRRKYALKRGINPPPAFVIARYSNDTATFTYRFAADAQVISESQAAAGGAAR